MIRFIAYAIVLCVVIVTTLIYTKLAARYTTRMTLSREEQTKLETMTVLRDTIIIMALLVGLGFFLWPF